MSANILVDGQLENKDNRSVANGLLIPDQTKKSRKYD